ncbi:UDP-N-acetylmuramoyl-tripeptide--D-alanyl-D-alanine ligase [Candidatus Bipolaricaulota bacterium]|nr:UDP-N-acetylmuramoyl-tripeptide--D-alanyl-D-alanine ligase [Candidatus Bipolaricaulota bacterium]
MLNPGEIAEVTQGEIHNRKELETDGFSIDTRTISQGDVFIPLPGTNTDGHEFIGEAYEKGAVAALAESRDYLKDSLHNLIVVDDTEKALLQMARSYRESLDVPIVGVTGSFGKTTTKELIASILSTAGAVHKSPGNYNTEYGLPLALLEMEEPLDYGVFELGLQYPGDVETLSKVVKPTAGIVTGVGAVHLGNFESVEEIAREKLKITSGMKAGAKLLINADSPPLLEKVNSKEKYQLVKYGTERREGLKYWVSDIGIKGTEGLELTLNKASDDGVHNPEEFPLKLETSLNSRGNAVNVLAAASIALELGLKASKLVEGIDLSPLPQRLQPKEFYAGEVIDDTYNANPVATRNALEYLSNIHPSGKKVFILGDMMELGENAQSLHKDLVNPVKRAGIDAVLSVGRYTEALIEALRPETGIPEARWFESKENLVSDLEEVLEDKDNLVLIKGSRDMKMEKVVSYLMEDCQ